MTAVAEPGTGTVNWVEELIPVAGAEVSVLKAGSGKPVLLLPRDTGHPPRRDFADQLAGSYTVYYPSHPGFHGSPDPAAWEWLVNVRDLAIIERQVIERLGLERLSVVGLGFGGWVAAEMATMSSKDLDALVLVGPMGIQPQNGYIYDQFLVGTEAYARTAFEDQAAFDELYGHEPAFEQLDAWETDRAMTSRLAWKPYMYNRALPGLLRSVETSALVITGDSDRVVPPQCAQLYVDALPNATLESMPGCGHAVDLEHPAALAAAVTSFLNRTVRQ